MRRHESILPRATTALLVIDMQGRLLPAITGREEIIERTEFLLAAARVLGIPVIYSEQYPKGLGATDQRLLAHLGAARCVEKMTFSTIGVATMDALLDELRPTHLLVAGIETHVCVAQSVLDLIVRNFRVSIAEDAVSSRRASDRSTALERMRTAGATITTAEAAVFELLEAAGTAEFKEILKLVK